MVCALCCGIASVCSDCTVTGVLDGDCSCAGGVLHCAVIDWIAVIAVLRDTIAVAAIAVIAALRGVDQRCAALRCAVFDPCCAS